MRNLSRSSLASLSFIVLGAVIATPGLLSLSDSADAAEEAPGPVSDGVVIMETGRVFLSCSVLPGEGGAVMQLQNNTGRTIGAGWAVFYQHAFDADGERSTLRLDTALHPETETTASFNEGEELSVGNCSAWTFLPVENAEPISPEELTSDAFAR